MPGHSGPCRRDMKCQRCESAEIAMFYDLDDCEHGIPGWDQCNACIALYETWCDSRDYAI